ncbi:amino acid adenylation domain-containing protein [Mucilaginibacter sp. 22184]|uniref:non-ribosomal peptide synthetase n=1 Tax=Mucilaginibacter sp. 22184 TaxID=3453887 RepID=UPI003F85A041
MFPIPSNQKIIWFDQKLFPDANSYNINIGVRIKGNIDTTLFERAINILIAQNDVLRSEFCEVEGILHVRIRAVGVAFNLNFQDFSGRENSEQFCMAWMIEKSYQPLSFAKNEFYSFVLLKKADNEYYWYLQIHQLIADAYSVGLMISKLASIYESLIRDERIAEITTASYTAYIQEEQDYFNSVKFEQDKKYWTAKFSAAPKAISVGIRDQKKDQVQSQNIRKQLSISRPYYKKLQHLTAQQGVTTFHFFLGLLYTYFARINQITDLVIGASLFDNPAFKNTLGCFYRTLPVRMDYGATTTFTELLSFIKNVLSETTAHQQFPAGEILNIVKAAGSDPSALFAISLSVEKQAKDILFNGYVTEIIDLQCNAKKMSLAVAVRENADDEHIYIDLDFNSIHWDGFYIEQFLEQFLFLLETLINNPEQAIGLVQIIPEQTKALLLRPGPVTKISPGTLTAQFEKAVKDYGNNLALEFEGEKLSYAELNKQSNALAHYLRNQFKVSSGQIIAFSIPKSNRAIITILGILKSGAAYLPIDPAYPEDRKLYMLEDSGASLLLAQSDTGILSFKGKTLFVDQQEYLTESKTDLLPLHGLTDPCYIIYTSGSTGKPKGVVVKHEGVVNIVLDYMRAFHIQPTERCLQFASLSFDVSVLDIFMTLFSGAALFPVSKDIIADFNSFATFIKENSIDVLVLPPSYLRNLNKACLSKVRVLITAGEAAIPREELQLRDDQEYYNGYGPTECSICVTLYKETDNTNINVPIGKPISNIQAFILDNNLQLLPYGVPGEIFFTGIGLARGYLNNPELTAEKFIPSPFEQGKLLYRTGDIGRWLADGNIEYSGRKDDQVKIRGHRIEPGEIEVALKLHAAVQNVAVVINESPENEKSLYAFIVTLSDVTADALHAFLKKSLPHYMIPDRLFIVPQIPLTINGKIDKKALLSNIVSGSTKEFVKPATPSEVLVSAIWQELLAVEQISTTDDFFQLGGHSLKVGRFINRVYKQTGIKLVFKAVFQSPVLKDVARLIDAGQKTVLTEFVKVPQRDHYPLSPSQNGIWLTSQLSGHEILYNIPLAFIVKNKLDFNALQKAFDALINKHEALRTSFTEIGGLPYQNIQAEIKPQIEISHFNKDINNQVANLLALHLHTRFDLVNGPLFRVSLAYLSNEKSLVVFTLHHIIADGWTTQLLLDELTESYQLLIQGKPINNAQQFQYKDYAAWLQKMIDGPEGEKQKSYWQNKLKNTQPFSLARYAGNNTEGQKEGAIYTVNYSPEIKHGLKQIAEQSGSTLFIILQVLLKILLFKLTRQRDIIIGTAVSGRTKEETEKIAGLLINTLALYDQVEGHETFAAFLQQAKATALEGLENQLLPFDKVVELVQPETNALFDVMISVDDQKLQSSNDIFSTTDPILDLLNDVYNVTKFNIIFSFDTSEQGLELRILYDTSLFASSYIKLIGRYFDNLATQVTANTASNIDHYALSFGNEPELFDHLDVSGAVFESTYPLTTSQRDIYLTSVLDPQGGGLRLLAYFEIPGYIDENDWKRAIERVTKREDSLRSALIIKDTEVFQGVKKEAEISFDFFDVSDQKIDDLNLLVKKYCDDNQDLNKPFFKHYLFKINEQHFITATSAHHIFTDGVSFKLLVEKIDAEYHLIKAEKAFEIQPIVPYREYVFNHLTKFDTHVTEQFWQQQLSNTQPLSYAGALAADDQIVSDVLYLSDDEMLQISNYCSNHKLRPPLFFKAIYALLVRYYCNADHDFCIRENLAGRSRRQSAMIGSLSHCFPLLIEHDIVKNTLSFPELCQYLKQQKNSANEFQHISLSLQNRIIGDEKLSFFYNYQYFSAPDTQSAISPLQQVYHLMDNQLELRIAEMPDTFELKLDYNERIFNGTNFLARIRHILTQIIHDDLPLNRIQFLIADELSELKAFGHHAGQKAEKNILELFEDQVRVHPDNTAIVFRNKTISYADLDARSDMVAAHLQKLGIVNEDIVAIMVERSAWMIIALLGVLKAGAAYLPIDHEYPQERIAYLLSDSKASVLLTHATWQERSDADTKVVIIEDIKADRLPEKRPVKPHQLAYVIYTSGTTGQPKGVMVEHQSLNNIARAWTQAYGLNTFKVSLLQMASFSFDVFTGDVIRALTNGGKLVISPSETRLEPASLYELIHEHQVNILESTPALIIPLMDYIDAHSKDISFLKLLILGSDICPIAHFRKLVERYAPAIRVINSYGVTEACIDSGFYEASADALPTSGNTPIGKPLENYTYRVCNSTQQMVPIGVPGELLIGGDGIARGYLGKEVLTAEKFITAPHDHQRIYKTGDVVRWLPDGNLEFAGRKDDQVKLRGYRIELQEIESIVLSQPGIKEAIVTIHGTENEKELIGWYTSKTGNPITNLKGSIKQHLPEYMVPAHFILLDKLPLTPNGKIDKKALPDPLAYIDGDIQVTDTPETETEHLLLAIWQDILKRIHIGTKDSFFTLGGHSLKATNAVARIFKAFQVSLPLNIFFNNPTIQAQAAYIDRQQKETRELIKPVQGKSYYPLSSSQKRLYLLHQIEGSENSYNLPNAFWIQGDIDADRLEQCFIDLIARHEILRTAFTMRDGEPVQIVKDQVSFRIERTTPSDRDIDRIISSFVQTFDLSAPPLLRTHLYDFEDQRKLFLLDMHHIISDGVSANLLTGELIRLYNGEKPEIPHIQYKDFAVWQNQFLTSETIKEQEKYWLERFSDEVPVLNLETDFARPTLKAFRGRKKYRQLADAICADLEKMSNQSGYTINQLLLTIFKVLLYKYSGNEDIVVGTPVAGRTRAELDHTLGMFVNTLALRSSISGGKVFKDFLAGVKQTSIEALKNQDYPFELLIDKLDIKRDMSRNPLFDVMFSFFHEEQAELRLGDARFEPISNIDESSKFDLLLQATKTDKGIDLILEYSTDLFSDHTASQLLDHYEHLLGEIMPNLNKTIGEINILTPAEEKQILTNLNNTAANYPADKCLHQLFEEQVSRFLQKTALVWNGQEISYSELHTEADCVAAAIRSALPSAKNPIIAVLLDRGPEIIVALLGILKAGGAYLPIDPDYPAERIQYMLDDSTAPVLITHSAINSVFNYNGTIIQIDRLESFGSYTGVTVMPDDLAYIIYTSGSTGKPKGVMIEHRNVVRLLFNDKNLFDFTEKDTWTLFHSYCFDFSVWEMYGALLFGGKLVIVPKIVAQSPKEFLRLLKDQRVTILNQTPGSFYNIIEEEMDQPESAIDIRYVIFGGEALKPGKLKPWNERYPNCRLINMYGITETTVHVTYKEITSREIARNTSNIGKPIPTLSLVILDRDAKLVPGGVAGELHVSGAGLARGYLNRPELTTERFIDHPYISGEKLYRTGDLAKMLPNGDFEYLGRIDHQVKIRGFRIELGEIENKLLLHQQVNDTLVIDKDDDTGTKYLCAYIVKSGPLMSIELRKHLATFLPDYMIPAFFVIMESFPLTGNGKIDRKRLPLPEGTDQSAAVYEAPVTAVEQKLAELWLKVLNVSRVGLNDHFFELGGQSLKAAQLVALIHKHFQVEVSIKNIFTTPYFRDLAALISDGTQSLYHTIEQAPVQLSYPASSSEKRLFILNQIDNSGVSYNVPGVYAIDGNIDIEKFRQAVLAITNRHEILRTCFVIENKEVVRKIKGDIHFDVALINGDDDALTTAINTFIEPFDLSKAPLIRASLLTTNSGQNFFMIDMHHIIADGVSVDNFIRELSAMYSGEALSPLNIQYKDFAVWQKNWLSSAGAGAQKAFWQSQFADEIQPVNMSADFNRPLTKSYAGDVFSFQIPEQLIADIKNICKANGATPFMVMLAAYNVLLSKYSSQEDIIVGTPVSGRSHADVQDLIGMFVNTLPLRNFPAGDKSFTDFVLEVKENVLKSLENQDYPFEQLLDDLEIKRDVSRNPLFDHLFTYRTDNIKELQVADLRLKNIPAPQHVAKMDLSLEIVEEEQGSLFAVIEYATTLFKPQTIKRLALHFNQVLEQIVINPHIKLKDIELVTAEEKEQLIHQFNYQTGGPKIEDARHMYDLFEEIAARYPDNVAVEAGADTITYKILGERVIQLADILISKGCAPDKIVGLYTDRSVDMIAGILAILRSGAAYLPIDPDYPQDRIKYMLEDSAAVLVITQSELSQNLPSAVNQLFLDDLHGSSEAVKRVDRSPSDVAYVIYTSGSTGKPKGVQIEHRSLYNFIFSNAAIYNNGFSSNDICTAFSSVSFDASVLEIFIPLAFGAKLVIVPRKDVYDVHTLADILVEKQVTFSFVPPSLLRPLYQVLKNKETLHLNKLDVGAESVKDDILRDYAGLKRDLQIVNSYGPTEAAIVSACYPYTLANMPGGNVPIGKPIHNVRLYVVNEYMKLQPVGVPGELCIAGVGLARGYLNNSELTKEKFIDNPFEPGQKLYKTGDLVKWLPDGNIDFIGRKDQQVKIRGFRIELGEIEAKLMAHPEVKQVLVIDKTDNSGNKFLCAYIVSTQRLPSTEYRTYLSRELPVYMIPAHFITLERFPLTKSEKIDRNALPMPDTETKSLNHELVVPANAAERTLLEIWKTVLELDRISVIDNFFELGGNSLKVINMLRLVKDSMGEVLKVNDLFDKPTIREQASVMLKNHVNSIENTKKARRVEF